MPKRCNALATWSCCTVGAAHWEVLLRARAIECQAYVIAAAQAGRHNEKRESYGHALIIDPWYAGLQSRHIFDPVVLHALRLSITDVPVGPFNPTQRRGKVCARLEDPVATGIAVADIDRMYLQEVRAKMPIKEHRAQGMTRYKKSVPNKAACPHSET
jgi:predicted amidohydrolase